MGVVECPCKGCEDRSIGCHGSCSKYAEYKEESAKLKKKYVDERSYYYWKDVHIQNVIRQRRSGKHRK